jgi:integrase
MSGTQRRPGRLGVYVDGYSVWLLELGHTPGGVRHRLTVLGQLGRWMASEGVDVRQLDGAAVDAFLAARSAEYRDVPRRRSLLSLLEYLRRVGVVGAESAEVPFTPLDDLIGQYRDWLVVERALAPPTVLRCQRLARRFLAQRRSPQDGLGVMDLTAADVAAFLLGESARLNVRSAAVRGSELRSLLRFLYLRGLTALPLADSVPAVAAWREGGIPVAVTRTDVERLLGCCDRSGVAGARDFAILILLARLGLRSIEVARLTLDDLYWRAGEIALDGKGHRHDRLPLPSDIGEALVGYLSLRDRRDARRLFLTLRAPIRPIDAYVVSGVVRRACGRAGVAPVCAHQLRHSLASELLRQGASLIDISQVLRHSDLASTAIYAKVDMVRLREVAQPWPEVQR